MNPHLSQLHPYPFEKLAQLKHGITPPADKSPIVLSIGEPTHATPPFIKNALINKLQGLSNYPTTKGIPELRQAIADWLTRRFSCVVNADTQVLPVSGTREALFSFAQCVIDASTKPVVIMPNPFYQIYEGAALLAGAEPYFLNTLADTDYLPDFDTVPESVWQRCQLIYICSPANPAGSVMSVADQEKLLRLAEKYDFVIASDECYSELYDDENNPPVGLLQTAYNMGNTEFKRCVVFHSLSKRSNAPGLRSGFVAGDAHILQAYFQYRTYQGCAMPLPTQYASISAWQDEAHVIENRRLYREKFTAFIEILADVCDIKKPPASFYVWFKIPEQLAMSDTEFTQRLFAEQNVTVLAGSFLSREFNGINPAVNHVRIALVASLAECIEAAQRIKQFLTIL
ncbi:MAG: succinyldiaminopimelate transaminase [Methylococcales bacterium]|nr:succinyldiaminopimelate transaminase [Methylococcales bacterium]